LGIGSPPAARDRNSGGCGEKRRRCSKRASARNRTLNQVMGFNSVRSSRNVRTDVKNAIRSAMPKKMSNGEKFVSSSQLCLPHAIGGRKVEGVPNFRLRCHCPQTTRRSQWMKSRNRLNSDRPFEICVCLRRQVLKTMSFNVGVAVLMMSVRRRKISGESRYI
jgi:hypothetical protein